VTTGATQTLGSTSSGLLRRVKAHDREAWQRLVACYGPLVHSWCRQWGLRDADAADVFQKVFRAVCAEIGSFHRDRPGDSFRGWLRKVSRNKALDHFRQQGRQPQSAGGSDAQQFLLSLPDSPDLSASDSAASQANRVLAQRALELVRSDFEERTWEIFRRAVLEQQPTPQICDELGTSARAVRQAKYRVLKRLREELEGLLEQD